MTEGPFTARRETLGKARRLVVKLGSSLLAPEGTEVRTERLRSLAAQIARLKEDGREVILVSSGAIASGMRLLKLKRRPEDLSAKQALAAIGQPELMRAYAEAFAEHGLISAQMLLTQEDTQARRRYINARNTLDELLARGIVPIVNENDTVAADEIRMGDNDLISALVALLAGADALVILTDTDGLLSGKPGSGGVGRVDMVEKITSEVRRMAGRAAGSPYGSGGMATKLQAAEKVTRGGHAVLIARGTERDVLIRAVRGESLGTLFLPAGRRLSSRKRWLAFSVKTGGVVTVDAGARAALVERGKSLLPGGIVGVRGRFEAGAAVALAGEDGQEFARGVVRYSSADLGRIKGRPAKEIKEVLGHFNGDEVVHRDNLVLTDVGPAKGAR